MGKLIVAALLLLASHVFADSDLREAGSSNTETIYPSKPESDTLNQQILPSSNPLNNEDNDSLDTSATTINAKPNHHDPNQLTQTEQPHHSHHQHHPHHPHHSHHNQNNEQQQKPQPAPIILPNNQYNQGQNIQVYPNKPVYPPHQQQQGYPNNQINYGQNVQTYPHQTHHPNYQQNNHGQNIQVNPNYQTNYRPHQQQLHPNQYPNYNPYVCPPPYQTNYKPQGQVNHHHHHHHHHGSQHNQVLQTYPINRPDHRPQQQQHHHNQNYNCCPVYQCSHCRPGYNTHWQFRFLNKPNAYQNDDKYYSAYSTALSTKYGNGDSAASTVSQVQTNSVTPS